MPCIECGKLPPKNSKGIRCWDCFIKDPGRNKRISISKIGEKNSMWKGDKVSRRGLHHWGERHIPKPIFCQDCKKIPPRDLANISQKYKRDITDWEWLCRKCHMMKDGRMERLIALNKRRGERNGKNRMLSL